MLMNVCKIMVVVRMSAETFQEVMNAVVMVLLTDLMRINMNALVRCNF